MTNFLFSMQIAWPVTVPFIKPFCYIRYRFPVFVQIPQPTAHVTKWHSLVMVRHVLNVPILIAYRVLLVHGLVSVFGLENINVVLRVRVEVQEVVSKSFDGGVISRVDEDASRSMKLKSMNTNMTVMARRRRR